jgi:predicted  nucleic acid-binding Zn-ribbon protein
LKEQIALIFALHELDLKGQKLQNTLDAMAPELQELETLVTNHRSQLEGKSGKIAELEKQKRSKEIDVETAEDRLKNFQGRLGEIKTNKEYQSALKEIADTKKLNKAMEDQILEIMTQVEGLKAEQKSAEENFSGSSANFEKRKGEVDAEAERIRGMIREVEAEKLGISAKIEPSLMAQYQRVRKGRSEAVSEVSGGTCQGCRMRVPPALHRDPKDEDDPCVSVLSAPLVFAGVGGDESRDQGRPASG